MSDGPVMDDADSMNKSYPGIQYMIDRVEHVPETAELLRVAYERSRTS